jgi:hypothetical protein
MKNGSFIYFLGFIYFFASFAFSQELLRNPDFSSDFSNWNILFNGQATGKPEIIDDGPNGKKVLRMNVATAGEKIHDATINQNNLAIVSNQRYLIRFFIKAEVDSGKLNNKNKINLLVKPFKGKDYVALKKDIKATSNWQEMKEYFTSPVNDASAVLSLDCGLAPGKYSFSDFSLTVCDTPNVDTVAVAGNQIEAAPQNPRKFNKKLTITNPTSVQPAAFKNEFGSERGQIISVDMAAQSVTVMNLKSHDQEVFNVDNNTQISLNGSSFLLTDIKTGMIAEVIPGANPLVAASIELKSK